MIVSLRRGYGDLLTSGGQLLLLVIGLKTESAAGMLVCVALMAPLSLVAWTSAFRRARSIADTPTSHIASAAQGYVELNGVGRPLAGAPLVSPLNALPCLWFRYTVERRNSENKWVSEDQGESDGSILVDDGTGQCLVDPENAEMLIANKESWIRGDRRYTQWLLIDGQRIYALGEFVTRGSIDFASASADAVKALLAEWKSRPEELLQRFDLDRNGTLDMKEWELARAQARREVAQTGREAAAQAEINLMRAPEDGRLYLISDLEPDRLATKYRRWSWFHLAVFFAALGSLPFLWHAR